MPPRKLFCAEQQTLMFEIPSDFAGMVRRCVAGAEGLTPSA
jgi:hypothetical protein